MKNRAVQNDSKNQSGERGLTARFLFLLFVAILGFGLTGANDVRAAATFQAAGTQQSGTGNVTVPWPAHQAGDVALLFVESTGGQAATLATANGFAAVTNSPQNTGTTTNGTRLTVYWARATSAAMASPVVTDPGDHVYARIITYRGVISVGDPWNVTGGGVKATASTSVTVTGVTTTVPDTLIVQAVARDNDSAAAAFSAQMNANLAGITERSDAGATDNNGGGIGIWDGVKATAGATGNTTATVTSSVNAFLTIALRPQTTYFSRNGGGNWNANATWSNAGCNGAAASSTPGAADDVIICDSHTVTVNAAAAAQTITLQTGNNGVNLTHAGTNSLTVGAGGVTLDGGTGGNQTKAWNINAGSATVNGPVNMSGGSNNNRIVQINLTTGMLDINGDLTMTAAANQRAAIEATGAANIFLSGDFIFNNGTLTPGPSSTFTYDGPGGFALAHSGTIQYRNLVVNKSGGVATQTGSTLTVFGDFDIQAGTVNIGTSSIAVSGDTTVSGTLGFTSNTGAATFTGAVTINSGGTWNNSANEAVTLGGNLINNGTFTAGTGIYMFSGGAAQSITGSNGGTTTFGSLTLNNGNGLTLGDNHDVTVSTLLTLTNGRITTNANILFISNGSAIANVNANRFVVGNLRKAYAAGNQTRVFEVGTETGGVRYAPVSITLGNVTGAGNFTVSSAADDHPNIGTSTLDGNRSINRYWTLTRDSVNFAAAAGNSIAFNYVAADFDVGATFGNFYAGRYNTPAWTEITPSARSATTTTISGAGITTATVAGDYQVAERAVPLILVSATAICGATNQVEVLFSAPATLATAQNIANYALSGGVTVLAAVLDGGGQIVRLTTSPFISGQSYTLTVNNVTGVGGGTVAPNSQATFFSEGGYQSGLLGNYFLGMTLSGTAVRRIDGPVDFNWAAGATGVPGIPVDNFSVRWEGFVTPPVSGNYTFRTRSDDGVRLYLDATLSGTQTLIINNWTDHSAVDNDSAVVALTAGQRYPITMEFYENGGDAVAQLSWSGPATGGFQFIPRSSLSHFCGVAGPVAFYKLDEAIWSGAGAVEDSSGNGFNGTAMNGATPVPAQVCNGAQLNGTDRYIQVNGLSNLLNATASLAFWIKTTQTGSNTNYEAPGVTGVEQAGGANDIFWGWLDATGRIGISVGDTTTTKSTVAINNGVWRHVVLTRNHVAGTYKIYIDGTLNTNGAIATGVIGTAFSSIGRIEDTGGSPMYLDGQLDEVRIYDRVLTDAEVLAIRDITRPCAVVFSHIRIEHTGLGLTCETATVTVKACADATCSTLYPGTVTTTLSPTGWVTSDTINFTGSTTAQLRKTTPGAVTLGAGSTAPAPASGTLCFNGGIQTCSLDFQDTGFIFSTIPTQVAGTTSATQTLRAVRKSDSSNACVGVFNGNVNIDLASQCVNPATCAGRQVRITNNGATDILANSGAGVSAWTTKSMTFGANSTASFTMNYPDVGAIRLNARHNIASSGDYMAGVSNDFVVKPAGFMVTNIRRTSDNFANPGAIDANGTVFMKAGENITLTAMAVNSQNNATPNYGRETAPEGVRLTTALVSGLGLTSNPAMGNGTIPGGSFSAGSATVTNVTWGEVGIITITPGVGDSDYLGAGDVTGTTTGNIGRFTPHHFDASANTPRFTPACTAGAFTYLGQPFNYASGMQPVLTVTARNLAGGTTQNYKGSFFKITNGTLTGKAYTAASGTLDFSVVTAPDPAIVDSGNGIATLTFNSGAGFSFVRSTLQAPFDAEISLAINVADIDSVAYSTNPARFGQATAGNGIAFSGAKTMRFGRLRLIGASGSQLLPLRIPFEAQYWTGTFFATNTLDTCTTVGNGNVALGNYIGNLSAGETTATTSPLVAGRGVITLSAPGAGNNGSVDVAFNLGTGTNVEVCSAFTPPTAAPGAFAHLRGQWCGAAYDKDPAARVRFGIRSGGDEQIYMRENY